MLDMAPAVVLRLLLFGLLWWLLTEGDTSTLRYAVVVVPLAVAASVATLPARPPRPSRWARRIAAAVGLFGWFLQRSFVGGWDVARRAISRPVDVDPVFVEHRFGLPPGPGRVVVVDLMNLMPGSLSARVDGDVLWLHVLHPDLPVLDQVRELERRLARVLDTPIET